MIKWFIEIEKKFLVKEPLPELKNGELICQGFLCSKENEEIKVRAYENRGMLSIKLSIDENRRKRVDIPISKEEALQLLDRACPEPKMKKKRYRVKYFDTLWEIDIFEGQNEGLIIAELELRDPKQSFQIPPWIGEEVTYDKRYYNSYLYYHPYCSWKEKI